jgi:hypothetical protein
MRRLHGTLPTALALVFVAAACSGSGDGDGTSGSASTGPSASQDAANSGPGLVDKPEQTDRAAGTAPEESTGAGDSADQDAPTALPVVTTVLPTVPEVGVPGIDSVDLFCRSWSEFAGSFQALALASTLATGDLAAQRSEVVASGAIVAAVDGLDEHLPPELEDEREVLIIEFVGPMERRAVRASADLAVAGLTTEQSDQLSEVWLTALVIAGVDEPDIELDIPADLAPAVEEAVASFSRSVPLIHEDPSLITDASVPLTEAYIVENCPDQGTLGGNDVIEQP